MTAPNDMLTVERHGPVAVVTLNRAHASNALSQAMQQALVDAFAAIGSDDAVHAVVLTGAGERTFCAGLDLAELAAGIDLVNGTIDPVAAVATCAKPVIAAVNGAAVTGGLELVLACDIAIASTQARFADSHARMGVIPGWGLSHRLSRAIGTGRAKEMSLTGRFVDADTALAWGLVNRVHAPQDLIREALAMAGAIAQWDPAFIAQYRALISQGVGLAPSEALSLERKAAVRNNATLEPKILGKMSNNKIY